MKKILTPLYILTFILFSSGSTLACLCSSPNKSLSHKEAVLKAKSNAAIVFSGEVIEVNDFTLKLIVNSKWKGIFNEEVILITTPTPQLGDGELRIDDCDYRFKVGKKYLVYAAIVDSKLKVSKCSRTIEMSDAKKDIRVLNKLKVKERKTKVSTKMQPS